MATRPSRRSPGPTSSPTTRTRILALLRQQKLLGTPECKAGTIDDAAVWADCIKGIKNPDGKQKFGETNAWHYQDVNICQPFDLIEACKDDNCVSAQIVRDAEIAQGPPRADRRPSPRARVPDPLRRRPAPAAPCRRKGRQGRQRREGRLRHVHRQPAQPAFDLGRLSRRTRDLDRAEPGAALSARRAPDDRRGRRHRLEPRELASRARRRPMRPQSAAIRAGRPRPASSSTMRRSSGWCRPSGWR